MIRIAVCDDTRKELEKLAQYIEKFISKSTFDIVYDCFSSGMELLARISAGVFYDLVFLDIVMPAVNGIETAKEIQHHNKATKIVFLTVSPEYAVDSYDVSALDYIIKPITQASFKRAVLRFFDRHKKEDGETIIFQDKSSITQIALYKLCYVEVFDHNLTYHLISGDTVSCRQSLSEIENVLTHGKGFVKTHRSYIINMKYIQKIEAKFITLSNGDTVPVSRQNSVGINDLFLKYKLGGA